MGLCEMKNTMVLHLRIIVNRFSLWFFVLCRNKVVNLVMMNKRLREIHYYIQSYICFFLRIQP